ncbi:MAG: hypothetical protein GX374_11090 [Bacilli bacterium]|nr:hypothetical protein [Bacilli bacterium]
MPVCNKCHRRWTWKQMFIKQFNLSGEMTCPYCGTKQYYAKRTKKWSGIIPTSAIVLIMGGNLVFGPSYLGLFFLVLFLPLYLLIFPFFVRLTDEEEPLF